MSALDEFDCVQGCIDFMRSYENDKPTMDKLRATVQGQILGEFISIADRAQNQYDALRRGWIDASKEKPRIGERVLCCGDEGIDAAVYRVGLTGIGYWSIDSEYDAYNVTHWQPLPPPPK